MAATRGSSAAYSARPRSVRCSSTSRRLPGRGVRTTRPFCTSALTAREVCARSSAARSASADEGMPSESASCACMRHSRRVMPNSASHRRTTGRRAAACSCHSTYSSMSSRDLGWVKRFVGMRVNPENS